MVSHIPIFWQKMLSNFSSQTLVENLQEEENCFIQTKVLTIKRVPMLIFFVMHTASCLLTWILFLKVFNMLILRSEELVLKSVLNEF